jgi:phytoene dehydrogenase-like protein
MDKPFMVIESDPRLVTYDDGDAEIDLALSLSTFETALAAEVAGDYERGARLLAAAVIHESLALGYRNLPVRNRPTRP